MSSALRSLLRKSPAPVARGPALRYWDGDKDQLGVLARGRCVLAHGHEKLMLTRLSVF